MKRQFLLRLLAVGAVGVGLALPARAQDGSGIGGIKLGVLTIFPTLVTSARYSDNIYFVPDSLVDRSRLQTQKKESDFIVNLNPDLLLDVTASTFNFQIGYNFYADIYAGYDDPEKEHDELNATNHGARARIAYTAPVGFFVDVKDQFIRQETFTTTDEFVDYVLGDQYHNDGTFTLGYRRPPQDTIYFGVSYRNIWDQYEKEKFDYYNRMGHFLIGDLRLKFFPRTAAVFEATGGTFRNPNQHDFDSLIYYGMAGLIGQLTNHLQFKAKGGFAVWDYTVFEDYRNFLASAELALVWLPLVRVAAGYDHRVEDATDTNFRVTDEVYLQYTHAFLARYSLALRGSHMWNDFSRRFAREERFLQGNFDFTVRILYWLYLGVGYSLEYRVVNPGEKEEVGSTRHIGLFKVSAKF